VNSVGEPGRQVLPNSRRDACDLPVRSVAAASRCGATAHEHSILVDSFGCLLASEGNAAGGAEAIVAAENIGGGTARDEGVGRPTSWQGRVFDADFEVSGISRQTRVNAGNTVTPRYETQFMYEDKAARTQRDGQYQGRVVGTSSVFAASVSSVGRAPVRPAGEPALGVMGGLLQPVSSPAEPPVSSLSGLFADSSTTAPAPFADFRPRDVSPTADAARAAMEVAPVRPTDRTGSPSGQGRKSCPPVPSPARNP